MDADFRKDLERASSWRLEMERPDGAGDNLADARRRRKAVEAIRTKGAILRGGDFKSPPRRAPSRQEVV